MLLRPYQTRWLISLFWAAESEAERHLYPRSHEFNAKSFKMHREAIYTLIILRALIRTSVILITSSTRKSMVLFGFDNVES